MYQIVNFSPEVISRIKISNQEKIRELTGTELDLLKAFEMIKSESNGFIDENEKAKEADKLFHELLKKNGVEAQEKHSDNKSTGSKSSLLRLREKERIRMLNLLELELQLAS